MESTLNQKQQEIFDLVLSNEHRFITLLGEGGSGKSFTIAKIVQSYPGSILLTATTHKATRNVSKMSGHSANTVQSTMKFKMVKKGRTMNLEQYDEAPCTDLLVIDEISMLPSNVYEAIVASDIKHVLFVGDPMQLEAVSDGMLTSSISGPVIELTEQMRNSTIDEPAKLYLAALRIAIESKSSIYPPIPKDSSNIVLVQDFSEFAFLYNSEPGTKKLVAYRNSAVDHYNKHISGGPELFNVGDLVVIDRPVEDGMSRYQNGDTVEVVDTRIHDDYIDVWIGNSALVRHWTNKKALSEKLNELAIEAKTGKGNWEKFWNVKEKSINLKHLHACTTHKAQGSSYDSIFIDGSDLVNASRPSQYGNQLDMNTLMRLSYVAISRMRTHAYIFVGSSRDYSKLNSQYEEPECKSKNQRNGLSKRSIPF